MAAKTGLTKKNAEAALNAFIETVSGELVKGEKAAEEVAHALYLN